MKKGLKEDLEKDWIHMKKIIEEQDKAYARVRPIHYPIIFKRISVDDEEKTNSEI